MAFQGPPAPPAPQLPPPPFQGLAAPNHDIGGLIRLPMIRGLLFPYLTYNEAVSLVRAARTFAERREYAVCILVCSSNAPANWDVAVHGPAGPPVIGGLNPVDSRRHGYCLRAPTRHVTTMWPVPICRNRAAFRNAATADLAHPQGYREPSFCLEPRHEPRQYTHIDPHPRGSVLVCQGCKVNRGIDLTLKLEKLKFGVCATCRRWGMANLRPGVNHCICAPIRRYTGARNNNEPRIMHLCRDHYRAYWEAARIRANNEIDERFWLFRTRPKKRGHGWSKKKKGADRNRTPLQRRKATITRFPQGLGGLPAPAPHLTATHAPRCYCGNVLTNADHDWQAPNDLIRNCVGCHKFWRTR